MSWRRSTLSLSLLVGGTLFACVDSGCPEGSREVDGACMALGRDAGTDTETRGIEGQGNAGTGAAEPGGSGTGGADRVDAGVAAGAGAGGSGADGGMSAQPDAAIPGGDASTQPAPTCDNTTCGENAACDASSGAPVCKCSPGYSGDGQACVNVDECASGADDCDANAACTDIPGSFSCECKPGYEGDGKSCTANPCEPRVNPCDATTTDCRVDAGKTVCDCKEGRGRCDANLLACSTDLASNADHCGECNLACAGDLACHDSTCDQPIKALALGYNHTCALGRDDRVLCWGANNAGQLQRASTVASLFEPAATSLGEARLISAGGDFSCAQLKNGDVVCWGSNTSGQIAPVGTTPTPPSQGLFTLQAGESPITQIACGATTSCVLLNGSTYCWGTAYGRELGTTATAITFNQADSIGLMAPPTVLSVGFGQACAVSTDRRLRCWGPSDPAPTEILDSGGTALTGVLSVASGITLGGGCALQENGRVLCWGINNYGQLGNPTVAGPASANAVTVLDSAGTPLTGAVQVQTGGMHACARRADGTVACWGRRELLGTGASGSGAQRSYVEVMAVRDAIDIAIKNAHTCVRRRTGQVQCWGDNAKGQLGVNPTQTALALEPVNVIGLP